jgi:hypothetical protein
MKASIFLLLLLINAIQLTNALETDKYLTHYWPITNGRMTDVIGNSDMTQENATSFMVDRFANGNAALALNGGWTRVPSGVYFNTAQMTITLWIYPSQIGSYATVFSFGNGAPLDNIVMGQSDGLTLKPYIEFWSNTTKVVTGVSSSPLAANEWQFLAVSIDDINMHMYLNEILVLNKSFSFSLPTISRNNCFIGKSHWSQDGYSHSIFDDLRFYNKSLTQAELLEVMKQNETGN